MNSRLPIALIPAILVATFLVLFVIVGVRSLRSYLGVKREQAYLLIIATMIGAAAAGFYRGNTVKEALRVAQRHAGPDDIITAGLSTGFFVLASVPLAIKLYRAWIGVHVSDAEKLPGSAGVRAWLSPVNLSLAILISVSALFAFGYALVSTFALLLVALLAYPLARAIAQSPTPQSVAHPSETLSAEREKILSMLEAGKITAEESAELLNALGATVVATQSPRASFSPQERTILMGAALVLVGFFLPWLSVNPGKEVSRLTGNMRSSFPQFSQQMPGIPSNPTPPDFDGSFQFTTPTVNIAGGDVPHGFGWIVLICAGCAPALPFAAAHLDARTCRTARLVAMGIGTICLIYVATQNVRFLNIGIILALAGYVIEWLGLLKPDPSATVFAKVAREV